MNNKMRRASKSYSFHQRVHFYNMMITGVIVICIILYNFITVFSINRYNETVNSINNLGDFYENVDLMTLHVKDYFYTEIDNSKERYEYYMEKAKKNLNNLKLASSSENTWRFQMLENMLNNYEEVCVHLFLHLHDSNNYQDAYNTFLETGTLIEKTSTSYYDLIVQDINAQLENLKLIRNMTIFASFFVFLILILWVWNYSHQLTISITRPIEVLLENISKVKQGEYDLSQISSSSSEMENLCNALDAMAHSVKANIQATQENARLEKQVLLMKNENLKKDEQLAQSELKMLQNQINPHFLFNTMNVIHTMALQEGAEDAADLLVKTSQLLRYGLDKQYHLSDIQSEVEMLKNYIEIQQRLVGDRIQFLLTLEEMEPIKNVPIPGMILQPLVENAIKHGLCDSIKGGEVEIIVSGANHKVYLCVSDNGKGMDSTHLERLIINDYQSESGTHLGLYNTIKRLQMFYQRGVTISINSDLDCGFEVIIEIELS